jgi:hypothetical protein
MADREYIAATYIGVDGDPFFAASQAARSPHDACVEAIHAEEERLGRKMTHREMEAFAVGFFADEYKADLRRIAALGAEELEHEEE